MDVETAQSLAIALAVGLIIGLERGWKRSMLEDDTDDGPGVRTFSLVGLTGGLGGLLKPDLFAVIIFFGVAVVAVAGYLKSSRPKQAAGYTTEIALLITWVLGFMAVRQDASLAIAAAVITALILGLKPEIHGVLRHIQRLELLSTLQLLVVAAVVLPLLPDQDLWIEGLNLHLIGWFVLLVLGLSWIGYVCLRLFGERIGILVTALLGGLTSSTAVTASFARRSAEQPLLAASLGRGILLACTIMPMRMLFLVAVTNPALLTAIVPGLATLIGIPLIAILLSLTKRPAHQPDPGALNLGNPLDLLSAAWFAAFLTALFIAVPWVQALFGDAGIYAAAALSGLTDVDAISLTLARKSLASVSSLSSIPASTASLGIVVAATCNTFVKAVLASTFSKGGLNRSTSAYLLLAGVAATTVSILL